MPMEFSDDTDLVKDSEDTKQSMQAMIGACNDLHFVSSRWTEEEISKCFL